MLLYVDNNPSFRDILDKVWFGRRVPTFFWNFPPSGSSDTRVAIYQTTQKTYRYENIKPLLRTKFFSKQNSFS
jgi:hypothetical protein